MQWVALLARMGVLDVDGGRAHARVRLQGVGADRTAMAQLPLLDLAVQYSAWLWSGPCTLLHLHPWPRVHA